RAIRHRSHDRSAHRRRHPQHRGNGDEQLERAPETTTAHLFLQQSRERMRAGTMPPPSSALRSQTQRRNVATQAPKSRSPKTLSTVDSKYVLAGIVHAHELRERPAPGFRAKPTRGHDRKQPLQRKPPKPRVTTI